MSEYNVNTLTICRDNYSDKEEFENAIKDAIMVLLNAQYKLVVRYDEPAFGIVCIDYDYDNIELSDHAPVWLSTSEMEYLETMPVSTHTNPYGNIVQ